MTRSPKDILHQLETIASDDVNPRQGKAFGWSFFHTQELEELAKQAYSMYLSKNAVDPRSFPSAAYLEKQVTGRVKQWLHASAEAKATFTSGGTESIMLAVKAARDTKGITNGNVVAPLTVHAAFRKAADYLGLEFRGAEVELGSYRAKASDLEKLIDEKTVLLVASAPEYAHGVVDDIVGIGKLAQDRGLPLHVDACIGGVLLSGLERAGRAIPDFDFRVDGVTSISVDLHKYAFCPKGASILVLADPSHYMNQVYICADWPGYPVVNTTVQSSRTLGPVAAAWAVLEYLDDGAYAALSERICDAASAVASRLEATSGIELLAKPDTSLVAFTTTESNVFELYDSITSKGWMVHLQPGLPGDRPNLHLTITAAHLETWPAFVSDVKECLATPAELEQTTLQEVLQGLEDGQKSQKGMRNIYETFLAMAPEQRVQLLKMAFVAQ